MLGLKHTPRRLRRVRFANARRTKGWPRNRTKYCYDANGNMVKRGGSAITYASYNLPTVITQGSHSSTLSYGAFRNRFKQVAIASGTTETTLYVGGLFEKVTRPGGDIEYRHYIPGGQGTAAIHTRRVSGSSDTFYWHADHLGSPELFTDSDGDELVRPSFGAFGERRDGDDWLGPPSSGDLAILAGITRRGFTGHEHLDSVGLIHMNGRVYDPGAGRFLSVDPILSVGLSQDINPYSYTWNSPLSVIDPSGLQEKDVVVKQCISCDWRGMDDMGGIIDFMNPNGGAWEPWRDEFNHPAGAALDYPEYWESLNANGRTAWDGRRFGGAIVLYGAKPDESTVGETSEVQDHEFVNPTGKGIRNDSLGQGNFDSPRGNTDHRGADYLADSGQHVLAPIKGQVTRRIDHVYRAEDVTRQPGLATMRGIEIVDEAAGFKVKIFYVEPIDSIVGQDVTAGQHVATAQNRAQYSPGMLNHVHLYLYQFHAGRWKLIDPQLFIPNPK